MRARRASGRNLASETQEPYLSFLSLGGSWGESGNSYGRAVAKIVCLLFLRGDTLVQYAACLCRSFSLFFREGEGLAGIIRFRLLWWGGCFNFFILCRYEWAFLCFVFPSCGG